MVGLKNGVRTPLEDTGFGSRNKRHDWWLEGPEERWEHVGVGGQGEVWTRGQSEPVGRPWDLTRSWLWVVLPKCCREGTSLGCGGGSGCICEVETGNRCLWEAQQWETSEFVIARQVRRRSGEQMESVSAHQQWAVIKAITGRIIFTFSFF